VAVFRYVVCDVFTDTPLAGNQLVVFTDAREIAEDRLQPLAREVNFSETVFVYLGTGDAHARIRIFTPEVEVPFAGHPILGTAFVLGGPLQLEVIRLETGRGIVPVLLEREGARIVFGRMEQPIPTWEPVADPAPIFAPSRSSSTGTIPPAISIRSTIFWSGPPSTNAVPSVGWPANGSSVAGVKIRMRTSAPSACGGSTNTVSEKFISLARACIVSGSRSRASVKTAS